MDYEPLLIMGAELSGVRSVRASLVANYSSEEVASVVNRTVGGPLNREIKKKRPWFIAGHFSYGIHEKLEVAPNYAVIVRDPYDRVVQHYYRALSRPTHERFHEAATRSLMEWARSFGKRTMQLLAGESQLNAELTTRDVRDVLERLNSDEFVYTCLYDRINEFGRWLTDTYEIPIELHKYTGEDWVPDPDNFPSKTLERMIREVHQDWNLYRCLVPEEDFSPDGSPDIHHGPIEREKLSMDGVG